MEVVFAVSYGALIFSSELSSFLAAGIGLVLVGALASGLLIALFSSLPGTVGGPQNITAAIMAVIASSLVVTAPPGTTPERLYSTVAATIALTTVLSGLFLLVVGHFKLGNLTRFLPFPVIGGILAGTGWLLIEGATDLMTGVTPSLASLGELTRAEVLVQWLPGLLFALLMLIVVERVKHVLTLPILILGALGLFYGYVWLREIPIAELRAQGWLLASFASATLWQPPSWHQLSSMEWLAVVRQLPGIATIVVVSVIKLLLNASALEVAVRREVDLNKELRAAGLGNVLAGIAGGLAGFQQPSLSILGVKLGRASRLVGLVAAGLSVAALLGGAMLLSLFPKLVMGGLLLFLGLTFLKEWLYDAWFRLPKLEYAIIVAILVVIGSVGFLEGVALGVVAAVILFVATYARVDVVRHNLSGRHISSRVTRSRRAALHLRQEGDRLYILQLQGYIFFGTAERLLRRVKERLAATDLPSLRFALLDFQRVSGFDSTAAFSFVKLEQLLAEHQVVLVLSGLTATARTQLGKGGVVASPTVRFFETMDDGMEWCESDLLRRAEVDDEVQASLAEHIASVLPGADAGRLLSYLKREVVAAGDYLIVQGEPADKLYLVESGQVTAQLEVQGRAPVRLETMSSGRVVGELGFLLNTERTASVVADEPGVVYCLTREMMTRLDQESPEVSLMFHRLLLHLLAERVTHLVGTVRALER